MHQHTGQIGMQQKHCVTTLPELCASFMAIVLGDRNKHV